MNIITKQLSIQTPHKNVFVDITNQVRKVLKESEVEEGSVHLFIPHTTAAVTINENADPDVLSDLVYGLNKTFPNDKNYHHFEGNSDAHMKSSLIGNHQTILISKGDLLLGTWQGIYFCEFDGPRTRKVLVQVQGTKNVVKL